LSGGSEYDSAVLSPASHALSPTLSGTVFFTEGTRNGNILPVAHEIVELWREIGEK
jgi:hypothetical protein